MGWWRSLRRVLPRLVFVLYCLEAGLFLCLIPWRDGWVVLVDQFAVDAMRPYLRSSFIRALICGFGVVHLLWALHDLHDLLRRSEDVAPG
ncbi:MAG: hypothetical protein DWQ36_04425 [Acidobacteria bacterium]|nr:MAG: hypothetical protein DWQ30_22085 [Acidobacteriota bacterium]REK10402.1 MAG: hypothetical protein DWQ36_04425 [Acidobacteriota bacterium]